MSKFTEEDWNRFLGDPNTKHVVMYLKNKQLGIYNKLKVQTILGLFHDVDNNIYDSINYFLEEPEENRFTVLLYLIDIFEKNCRIYIENHNKLSYIFKNIVVHPYIINKNYTDLILYVLKQKAEISKEYIAKINTLFDYIQKEYLTTMAAQIQPYKEELIATAWRPERLQQWIDSGYSIDEISEF